jgi:hypothetical protein
LTYLEFSSPSGQARAQLSGDTPRSRRSYQEFFAL